MKIRNFLNTVPLAAKRLAVAAAICELLAGLAFAYHSFTQGDGLQTVLMEGAGFLIFALVIAAWVVCLGFVYADARQRAMRPVLWVLVAALFPHLLGFLLYFVLRQPIASTCTHCGQKISPQQPFCAWCGQPQTPNISGGQQLAADLGS